MAATPPSSPRQRWSWLGALVVVLTLLAPGLAHADDGVDDSGRQRTALEDVARALTRLASFAPEEHIDAEAMRTAINERYLPLRRQQRAERTRLKDGAQGSRLAVAELVLESRHRTQLRDLVLKLRESLGLPPPPRTSLVRALPIQDVASTLERRSDAALRDRAAINREAALGGRVAPGRSTPPRSSNLLTLLKPLVGLSTEPVPVAPAATFLRDKVLDALDRQKAEDAAWAREHGKTARGTAAEQATHAAKRAVFVAAQLEELLTLFQDAESPFAAEAAERPYPSPDELLDEREGEALKQVLSDLEGAADRYLAAEENLGSKSSEPPRRRWPGMLLERWRQRHSGKAAKQQPDADRSESRAVPRIGSRLETPAAPPSQARLGTPAAPHLGALSMGCSGLWQERLSQFSRAGGVESSLRCELPGAGRTGPQLGCGQALRLPGTAEGIGCGREAGGGSGGSSGPGCVTLPMAGAATGQLGGVLTMDACEIVPTRNLAGSALSPPGDLSLMASPGTDIVVPDVGTTAWPPGPGDSPAAPPRDEDTDEVDEHSAGDADHGRADVDPSNAVADQQALVDGTMAEHDAAVEAGRLAQEERDRLPPLPAAPPADPLATEPTQAPREEEAAPAPSDDSGDPDEGNGEYEPQGIEAVEVASAIEPYDEPAGLAAPTEAAPEALTEATESDSSGPGEAAPVPAVVLSDCSTDTSYQEHCGGSGEFTDYQGLDALGVPRPESGDLR